MQPSQKSHDSAGDNSHHLPAHIPVPRIGRHDRRTSRRRRPSPRRRLRRRRRRGIRLGARGRHGRGGAPGRLGSGVRGGSGGLGDAPPGWVFRTGDDATARASWFYRGTSPRRTTQISLWWTLGCHSATSNPFGGTLLLSHKISGRESAKGKVYHREKGDDARVRVDRGGFV